MKGKIVIHIDIPDKTTDKMRAALKQGVSTTALFNVQKFVKTEGKEGTLPSMYLIDKMGWELAFE